ncbi:MAG: hypothetical protein FWG10_08765 [Eubacteriaceae bacterium]|nr:hypothetical protein [Eubacteriaceae bacterium]
MDSGDNPSKQQYRKLLQVTGMIKRLQPWNFMEPEDIVTVRVPNLEEPLYCLIAGGKESFCVEVYPGHKAYSIRKRLLANYKGQMPSHAYLARNCLLASYVAAGGITPTAGAGDDSQWIKFPGTDDWVRYHVQKPGYFATNLTSWQAGIMLCAAQNLYLAANQIQAGELEVDFNGGETALCYYSEVDKAWLCDCAEFQQPAIELSLFIVEDSGLVEDLNKMRQTRRRLEFDILYVPVPCLEKHGDRVIAPKLLLLLSRRSTAVAGEYYAEPDEDITEALIDLVCKYIFMYGKPLEIYVRDLVVGSLLADLCKKTGIGLVIGEEMAAMDYYVDVVIEAINEEGIEGFLK